MNSQEAISFSEVINNVFSNISIGQVEESNKIVNAWRTTVSKISGNGEKLAAHSKVVDLKNGILLVETDHPGWTQMLQIHKKFILRGLEMNVGELGIRNLAFRLKGTDAQLVSVEEMTQKSVEKSVQKLNEDEKKLEEKGFLASKTSEKQELPPELSGIFSNLKKSVLTNEKNK